MHFIKAGLIFAGSTLSKLLAGLVILKLVAVTVGAGGLGRLGQFMSLMSMITILAGGGITTGVIKYVAQHRAVPEELGRYLGAASGLTLVASTAFAGVLLFAAPAISSVLFGVPEYADVVRLLAFAQFFIAANNLFFGIMNGFKRVKAFAVVNSIGMLLGAAGSAWGCVEYGLKGAMYGLIWMPVCPFILLAIWYRQGLRYEWHALLPRWNKDAVRKFLSFTLMLLVTVVTMQMAQILIRNIIEAKQSWVEVGYWQAVTKVSDAYLQFVTVVLANYFLPRLAELRYRKEVAAEIYAAYRYAMPVLIFLSLGIYLFRDPIVILLFSRKFLPMHDYFNWQLVGDVFKVAAYIGAYVAVARADTKIYVAAEIFQASLLVSLSYLFVSRFGAIGATYAYSLTYFIYFSVVTLALRLYFRTADHA